MMAWMGNRKTWVGCAAALAIGTFGMAASAAAPATLTQQGRILSMDGEPVDGEFSIVFTLYDAAEEGNAVWTETQSITLDEGYFSAALGEVEAIDPSIFDGSVLYLGVTLGNDDEMAPRQAVRSVPYALSAGSAPFSGLTGIPAPCGTGEFLSGFSEAGEALCESLPTLSCTTRYSDLVTGTTTNVGCQTGEVLTGGGCYTNGTLRASYHDVCTLLSYQEYQEAVLPPIEPPIIINPCLLVTNNWMCTTTASASIRAYARCCSVD